MSACVVAEFPWQAVRGPAGSEPPCVLIFCDSRVSDSEGPLSHVLAAKQCRFSKNLIVCYTSSNLAATVAGLDRALGAPTTKDNRSISTIRDVRRLGRFLSEEHAKTGGFTELIAVVWEKHRPAPQILEAMPSAYEPRPSKGIIGIGDGNVLERFQELFREHPCASPFPVGQAAAQITAAFSQAIEEVDSPTVGYPLQITTVTKDRILSSDVYIYRRKSEKLERLTARDRELTLPSNPPPTIEPFTGKRVARQLFA